MSSSTDRDHVSLPLRDDRGSFRALLFATAWILVVGAGFWSLSDYESTMGVPGNPPAIWPEDCGLTCDLQQTTLIMLAHPKCPCTRASIAELNRLMASCAGRTKAHVLFFDPEDEAVDWVKTDLWRSAAAIPGVRVARDKGGRTAGLFRISTSGHVLLYSAGEDDAGSRLLFSGGITASRGHEGDNAGRNALAGLILGERVTSKRTPTFGCSLTGCDRSSPADGRKHGKHP